MMKDDIILKERIENNDWRNILVNLCKIFGWVKVKGIGKDNRAEAPQEEMHWINNEYEGL
jgi:hypothetical protein